MRPCFFLLSILTLLSVSPAVAQSLIPCTAGVQCPKRYYWESAPLTRTPPSAAPASGAVGSGMDLAGVEGARVALCPASGQSLTGTGSLRAYLYDPAIGEWMRSPDLDLPVSSATTTANRCRVWPDAVTAVRGNGRVLYATDAIGVSGGTSVSVYIVAQVRL
ncbi:MAG TPA: hypothetical protein VEZ71_31930 [Archangium sp.]|nr:hypothetical protein [Archangium sp.]